MRNDVFFYFVKICVLFFAMELYKKRVYYKDIDVRGAKSSNTFFAVPFFYDSKGGVSA